MKPNPKISAAVAAILSVPATAIVFAAPQAETATASGGGGELQEVVVTAQRRAENLQDVPITVQAISGEQLKELNVVSFNDLLKYTPNVSYSGNGPGTGNIFMRGLGGAGSGNQSQSTTAPFPNVAVYLDEQSMQFPARNNDVYLVDMERVEVLEGPQGTLFGGGAQAGAIRYITNKPKYDAVSGEVNAGYGITAHGDPNTLANATFNLPVTPNFALRATVFTERRGGYIDNVPGTIGYIAGTPPHDLGGNPTANNGPLAARATNPVTYQGARVSAAVKFNDDWDLLLQQNYQNFEADGYFYAYPVDPNGRALNKYEITAFEPAYTKDKYDSTAWTLNGRVGDLLNVIYTGSYMVRHIEGQQDYSNYMRSNTGSYYACIGTGAGYFYAHGTYFPQLAGHKLQCSTAVGNWHDSVRNIHQSHEIRVSTNADNRFRVLGGLYWEKFVIDDDMNFNYLGIPQCNATNLAIALAGGADCLSAVGPLPGTFANDPNLRLDSNTAFGEDIQRGYKQRAVFASADFDIVPKVLTATFGARFYHYDEFEHGSEYYSETSGGGGIVVNHINGACTLASVCGFPINLDKSEQGHRLRWNLTWHITPDMMAYYTHSEGFRPGGFNRTSSLNGYASAVGGKVAKYCGTIPGVTPDKLDPACGTTLTGNTAQFTKPVGFDSDQLTNNEVGFKSEFLNHHVLLNLSGYVMDWKNVQLSLFDPVHLGNTTFNINGPTYRVKGFEVQFVAKLAEGLTLEGSSSVNSAEQTNAPCLRSNRMSASNPTPIGDCITVIKQTSYTNPYGLTGTRPAFSPPWMFNLRARYEWEMTGFRPFFWVGASHIGPESNEPASFPSEEDPTTAKYCAGSATTTTLCRYTIPGYTTYDAAVGVAKDNWTLQLTGTNISNEYGPTNISSGQFIKSEIPLRPRVLMAQFGWKF
ncbi:MAG: TonB-dependent receptor [Gammaproteobacteria bacterium]|nr:TonB-dependent receptor [Gammaproteobacteria bacterium]MBV9620010.1 TonB-dependent receptor [Gammaproteobacteria bacterium]